MMAFSSLNMVGAWFALPRKTFPKLKGSSKNGAMRRRKNSHGKSTIAIINAWLRRSICALLSVFGRCLHGASALRYHQPEPLRMYHLHPAFRPGCDDAGQGRWGIGRLISLSPCRQTSALCRIPIHGTRQSTLHPRAELHSTHCCRRIVRPYSTLRRETRPSRTAILPHDESAASWLHVLKHAPRSAGRHNGYGYLRHQWWQDERSAAATRSRHGICLQNTADRYFFLRGFAHPTGPLLDTSQFKPRRPHEKEQPHRDHHL